MEEIKRILPFSIYDFFGYIFPAIIFIVFSIFLIITAHPQIINAMKPILNTFSPLFEGSPGFASIIFVVLFSIAGLYFFGHAIGTLSHILYDRIIVKNIFGYPIESLLGIPQKRKRTVEATYFYLITLIAVMMFSVLIDRFLDYEIVKILLNFIFNVGWKIAVGVALLILILNRKYYDQVGKWDKESKKRKIFDLFSDIYYAPYRLTQYLVIYPLFTLFSCTDKMPDIIQYKFFIKYAKQLNMPSIDMKSMNTETYWLPLYDIYQEKSPWKDKIENWMNLYGFMRNLSTAGYLLCIEIGFIFSHNAIERFGNPSNKAILIALYYGILLISILIGIRFWIIYRNYYSKNIIRGYVYNEIKP